MAKMPNPFEFAASDAAAEQAVASMSPAPSGAAADHSHSGATDCPPDEAAASARQSDDAAVGLIAEIFVGADKLNDPEARFVLDVERFMLDIDEPPLFLRQAV